MTGIGNCGPTSLFISIAIFNAYKKQLKISNLDLILGLSEWTIRTGDLYAVQCMSALGAIETESHLALASDQP